MTEDAFLSLDGDVYLGLPPARGPWSPDHCHAGPVAGAVARSFEAEIGAGKRLVRLTLDLVRPAPMAGFRISVRVTRNGRRLATVAGELTSLDGKICASATGMFIAPAATQALPSIPEAGQDIAEARPGGFPIDAPRHDSRSFSHFIEVVYPPGEDRTPGPTTLWMKTPPLLATETPSSFQRICPLADCGNAIGRNAEISEANFVNTDLTIVVHRQTDEDWLLSEAHSHWRPDGIGLAEARISDRHGALGTALQSLIVSPA